MNQSDQNDQDRPGVRLPSFRLGTLLVVMLALAVIAAGVGYMIRSMSDQGGQSSSTGSGALVFMLFSLAAPVLLMTLLSVARQFVIWINRLKR